MSPINSIGQWRRVECPWSVGESSHAPVTPRSRIIPHERKSSCFLPFVFVFHSQTCLRFIIHSVSLFTNRSSILCYHYLHYQIMWIAFLFSLAFIVYNEFSFTNNPSLLDFNYFPPLSSSKLALVIERFYLLLRSATWSDILELMFIIIAFVWEINLGFTFSPLFKKKCFMFYDLQFVPFIQCFIAFHWLLVFWSINSSVMSLIG